jgi:hypothetical protein
MINSNKYSPYTIICVKNFHSNHILKTILRIGSLLFGAYLFLLFVFTVKTNHLGNFSDAPLGVKVAIGVILLILFNLYLSPVEIIKGTKYLKLEDDKITLYPYFSFQGNTIINTTRVKYVSIKAISCKNNEDTLYQLYLIFEKDKTVKLFEQKNDSLSDIAKKIANFYCIEFIDRPNN